MSDNEHKNNETVNGARQQMPNIPILSDENTNNIEQLSYTAENHKGNNLPEMLHTPQKCHNPNPCKCNMHKLDPSSLSRDTSNWMLADRPMSRSPPSPTSRSPKLIPRSPMLHQVPHSLDLHRNTEVLNFSQERIELYPADMEARSVLTKKRLFEDITSGNTFDQQTDREPKSPACFTALTAPARRQIDILMSPRQLITLDSQDRMSPREQQDTESQCYRGCMSSRCEISGYCSDPKPFLAKRRLDVDNKHVTTPKRLKIDLEREMGQRYMKQLASDISAIKQSSNCTCAIMERQFLEMAESAYRSVRRLDSSPRGFEQFRLELIQTNEVMKDSMEVLKNIKSFCEHTCTAFCDI